jgi:hypothetical protein
MKGAIAIPRNEKRPVSNQAFPQVYENFSHPIVSLSLWRVN